MSAFVAHAHRVAYWHSESCTCYVRVERCPACRGRHAVVVLYENDDHWEFSPNDFLNGVLLPCGKTADLILEDGGE